MTPLRSGSQTLQAPGFVNSAEHRRTVITTTWCFQRYAVMAYNTIVKLVNIPHSSHAIQQRDRRLRALIVRSTR